MSLAQVAPVAASPQGEAASADVAPGTRLAPIRNGGCSTPASSLRAAWVPDIGVPDDDWTAFNLGRDGAIALLERWPAWLATLGRTRDARHPAVARTGSGHAATGNDGADRLVILRHTLMNPYLIDHENDISYIDLYFEHLARRVRALSAPPR